jgi:class 3 adenylate cyclase
MVIANYNDQERMIRDNMDLQSVSFVSYMLKHIKEFEKENQRLSDYCKNVIHYVNQKIVNKIPKTNSNLKLDLLTKILPFNLEKDYINFNHGATIADVASTSSTDATATFTQKSGNNKELNFICVLFMDIVNYTELAKKYNGDIIFKLLHQIYLHFDNIIKKYQYLQKIETIGDAYMVVGDIYRKELNYTKVIREIILLAMEFVKEIKTIETPDNNPLCIRIGINIGSVNIGILGNEIPRLCVVGNSVNVAARLQSTAEEDTIQISRHIYEQLGEIDFGKEIQLVRKDDVFLKNIGTVTTYNIYPFDRHDTR